MLTTLHRVWSVTMDEYDIRRLPEYNGGQIKLSADDLKCLIALEPRTTDVELRRVACPDVDVAKILRDARKR